jgi:hypothetical protein
MKTKIMPAAVIAAAIAAFAASANAADKRVSFDSLPTPVQFALTGASDDFSNEARASVFQGSDNGHATYTGRITDTDGTMRVVKVYRKGDLWQVAPPQSLPGRGAPTTWNGLPASVQRTLSHAADGRPIHAITRRLTPEGTVYVAQVQGELGQSVILESDASGRLLNVR